MRATIALVLVAALLAGGIGYELGQARGASPPAMEWESQGAIAAPVLAGVPAGLTPEERSIIGVARQVDDVPITQGGDLRRALRARSPGTEVALMVHRSSRRLTVRLRLAEAPGT